MRWSGPFTEEMEEHDATKTPARCSLMMLYKKSLGNNLFIFFFTCAPVSHYVNQESSLETIITCTGRDIIK